MDSKEKPTVFEYIFTELNQRVIAIPLCGYFMVKEGIFDAIEYNKGILSYAINNKWAKDWYFAPYYNLPLPQKLTLYSDGSYEKNQIL